MKHRRAIGVMSRFQAGASASLSFHPQEVEINGSEDLYID